MSKSEEIDRRNALVFKLSGAVEQLNNDQIKLLHQAATAMVLAGPDNERRAKWLRSLHQFVERMPQDELEDLVRHAKVLQVMRRKREREAEGE